MILDIRDGGVVIAITYNWMDSVLAMLGLSHLTNIPPKTITVRWRYLSFGRSGSSRSPSHCSKNLLSSHHFQCHLLPPQSESHNHIVGITNNASVHGLGTFSLTSKDAFLFDVSPIFPASYWAEFAISCSGVSSSHPLAIVQLLQLLIQPDQTFPSHGTHSFRWQSDGHWFSRPYHRHLPHSLGLNIFGELFWKIGPLFSSLVGIHRHCSDFVLLC